MELFVIVGSFFLLMYYLRFFIIYFDHFCQLPAWSLLLSCKKQFKVIK